MSLPAILHVRDLVRLTDWSPKQVRRFVDSNKLATRDAGRNGERLIMSTAIEAWSPEVFRTLDAKWDALEAGRSFSRDSFEDLAEQ